MPIVFILASAQTDGFFRQGIPRILTLVHSARAEAFAFMPPLKAIANPHDALGCPVPGSARDAFES